MIFAFLIFSVILTVIFTYLKRFWKELDEKAWRIYLYDKLAELFLCSSIACAFFAVLDILVNGTTDETTLAKLESLEGFLLSVKGFAEYIKLAPWQAAIAILVLIAFELLIERFWKPIELSKFFKIFTTWAKRLYITALLLCSFTFSGNQLGENIAHLRIRTDKIRAGYARLDEDAETMLRAAIRQELYDRVWVESPPEFRQVRDYRTAVGDAVVDFTKLNGAIRSYSLKSSSAEVLNRYSKYRAWGSPGEHRILEFPEPKPSGPSAGPNRPPPDKPPVRPPLNNATESSVKAAQAAIESKKTTPRRYLSLLKLNSTQELLCQFPKSFTSAVKSQMVAQIKEAFPILEPVIEAFFGAADKVVDEKVKSAATRIADTLHSDPGTFEPTLRNEARAIAETIEVSPKPGTSEKLKNFISALKAELTEIVTELTKLRWLVKEEERLEAERKQRIEEQIRIEEERRKREAEELKRRRDEEIVDCYCEGRFMGKMKRAQCPVGQRCG